MKTLTIRELIDSPEYRLPDGRLTDAAHAAYRTASALQPDGFIPDDELDHVTVDLEQP